MLQSFPQIPSHVALAVLQALGQHITLRCQAVSADLRALITHLALRVMLWTMALSYTLCYYSTTARDISAAGSVGDILTSHI